MKCTKKKIEKYNHWKILNILIQKVKDMPYMPIHGILGKVDQKEYDQLIAFLEQFFIFPVENIKRKN